MKKLVISALAASVASATALASESEWADLDRDVQALSASMAGLESSGVKLDGYIRATYATSSDIQVAPSGNDLGGFSVNQARLKASGSRGNVGYVVQAGYEFAGSEILLLDAYLTIPVGENLQVQAGQFRAIVSRDSLVSRQHLFFIDRSQIGELFEGRNQGLALKGNFDQFDWAVTVQDGSDGDGDELFFALHGAINFLGQGAAMSEGAYGNTDEIAGTIGASYWDDGQLDNGSGLLFQATIATSMYSVNAWVADIDDDIFTANATGTPVFGNVVGTFLEGDSTPFGIMGTFMITQPSDTQGGWELGVRFQDMDDSADTNIIDFGVNYLQSGHDLKYHAQFTTVDSDAGDGDAVIVGVTVGF